MDVTHLRSLLALAETGSLTRAAERLNYAPSSVSAHLRSIETELGIELTERAGRGIALTLAGREFVPHARGIVDAMSNALTNLQANRPSVLTIAAIQSIAAYGLPEIAADLAQLGISLSMRTVTSCADNMRGVAEGEHDLGLTLQESASIERFCESVAHEVLCDVAIAVVAAPSHRLAGSHPHGIAALTGETVIETEPGCAYRKAFEDQLDVHGITLGARFMFEDFTVIRALARSGVGIAVMPRFVAIDDITAGALVELPFTIPGAFKMVAAWRRGAMTEPLVKVLDVLRAGALRMVGDSNSAAFDRAG
jgi:DNA-binding transcriptional LysR family regulator